jgi:drug/metabolite transporter (DMT)-like permease
MATAAFFLALSSAALHATWNLLVKTSDDRLVTAWAAVTTGGVVFFPALVATGGVPPAAWGYLLASGVVHTGYASSLARAYDTADFSLAYPLARGISPALAAVGGVVFLEERIGGVAVLGLVVVSAALLWIAYHPGGLRASRWAIVTGATIAVYSVIDAAGVRAADNALGYTAALFLVNGVLLTPVVVRWRGAGTVAAAVRSRPGRLLLVGSMSLVAYALVLGAALLAPIGLVSAVRETSVILGAVAGTVLLGEAMGARRVTAATLVVVGVVLLGVS